MQRWMRHCEDNGTVWRDPRLRNLHANAAIRNPHLTRAIFTLVETGPAAFLGNHIDLLVALSLNYPASDHRYVSASTVYRVLRFHQYTCKNVERLYAESCLATHRTSAELTRDIPPHCMVPVDETQTEGSDMLHIYGRSICNVPCVSRDRDARPLKRTSTMMALSLYHGVPSSHTVIAGNGNSQTSDDWRLFLQCLQGQMSTYIPGLPWDMQPDACVVLYDISAIQDERGDDYIQANGICYVRLPPYSPNLQLIEGVFSELKKNVRALVSEDGRYMDKPFHVMAAAVSMLTAGHVAGQFSRVSQELLRLLSSLEQV